ncbi:LysR family glycine cleavage system transcriptional activator [Herbaspirillum sp. 1173]|uniref:LysR substrate-binding domain-containing protein n=1 Tax=Herbaspirillum sp. 1173 TaxID=2817734 RepID=UPI002867029F|nr:LysR substrate-binding domain-containing protein [Herbaspirillum sp. 1173]MDR6742051.1 LysR family glycine cleavage system transcriptional activator [Herbaspirillum sp. 1173]
MIPPLTSLMAFEAIARRKSFNLAAAELHLTPSAISHQVARLEKLLGLRLFERSTKGVELTPAGQSYLNRVAGALGAINSATDDLRHGVENSLQIHSSPSFASLWLMPRIGRFTQRYPEIAFGLSASPEISDFEIGQVDLDIRCGVPHWPDLEIEPVLSEQVIPMASPDFLARHRIETPEDLVLAPLIQSRGSLLQWPEWFARYAPDLRPERIALRFDRAMMSIEAAVQGLGVVFESDAFGAGHLASGRLQPVFSNGMALEITQHFAVCPARNKSRPEVVLFLQWLREESGKLAST